MSSSTSVFNLLLFIVFTRLLKGSQKWSVHPMTFDQVISMWPIYLFAYSRAVILYTIWFCMATIERMRTPVRHISYGIRHTALSRTNSIVAYVRHDNNADSPVFWYSSTSPLKWIVSAPDEAPVRMEPAHSPEFLIQNTWMWKKKNDRRH